MSNVGSILGMPENKRTYEDSTKLALARCLTGIEVECENVKSHLPEEKESWASTWMEEQDNSLRGEGREFVLEDPLFGDDLVQSISWFCRWAKEKKFEANYRTGLHVHIDARNLEMDQLVTMVIYYALFEKVLFKWVGDNREGSVFCLPFYKAEGVVDTIGQAFSAPKGTMRDGTAAIDRYAALNLNALSKYGSVEWRHLQTTFDEDRIFKWINCAQSFKKYAKHNPLAPWELLDNLSKLGPRRLLSLIVGTEFGAELWYDKAEEDVWKYGLPISQDLCMLLDSKNKGGWDTLRKGLKQGTNLGFMAWAAKKTGLKSLEKPQNIYVDPLLLTSPELQREALADIQGKLRTLLDNAVFA